MLRKQCLGRRVRVAIQSLWMVLFLVFSWGPGWCQNGGTLNSADDALDEILNSQLAASGNNRSQLQAALDEARSDPQVSAYTRFTIAYMPRHDLQQLSEQFILENARYAAKVRRQATWQNEIPEEIFLNNVLPYASVDEPRDPWRADFHARFAHLVAEAPSLSSASQTLNEKIFEQLKVKYSTARKRANQSPRESIEQGLASCSGLSIILVDACRAVGIPARLAGIAEWPNKSGNHTWVEVWDQGWHFTGAAEFDPQGLDHAWFQADASLADESRWENSIFATSYRHTGHFFPLVWDSDNRTVPAVNVSQRYARKDENQITQAAPTRNLFVRVWDPAHQQRVAATVTVWPTESPMTKQQGISLGPEHDMNDMLSFSLLPKQNYIVQIGDQLTANHGTTWRLVAVPEGETRTIDLELGSELPPAGNTQLSPAAAAAISAWFEKRFTQGSGPGESSDLAEFGGEDWTRAAQEVRDLGWKAFLKTSVGEQLKEDDAANRVRYQEYESPFAVRSVGTEPTNGWPLVIAMHGGGNAPQELNDSQWKVMQTYYHDHVEAGGYRYLALRAPNNTWNGFYDNYVYPLIENLIFQQIAFGNVDPNRVYLIGYSHGGYGAFSIGPKIADRFAAVHSSAAAPTDGESSALNLRNTRFTYMIGENDDDYGRRERCQAFDASVQKLRAAGDSTYPVELLFKTGYAHRGLPDKEMLRCMLPFSRTLHPRHICWEPTDPVVKHFYWISAPEANKGARLEANWKGNQLYLTTTNLQSVDIWLDDRLGLTTGPVEVIWNGKSMTQSWQPRLEHFAESIVARRDPNLAYLGKLTLKQE